MGKHEVGTPKYIANKIKAKGLQKLRWFCQMCQKQCRDENGFKCHTMSESHHRQLLLFADNAHKYMDQFSREFSQGYLNLLKRQFGTKRVPANRVYQEYIADREHVHMNATQWLTLTAFVKWLGRTGQCVVDETEKGWFVTYIDRDPETIAAQEKKAKKEKMDKDDEERLMEFIGKQVEKGKQEVKEDDSEFKVPLVRPENDAPLVLDIKLKPKIKPVPVPGLLSTKSSSLSKDIEESISSIKKEPEHNKRSRENRVESSKKIKIEPGTKLPEGKTNEHGWLQKHLAVKVITKSLGEKYYKSKGIIQEVDDAGFVAKVKLTTPEDVDGHVIKLDQEYLETIIPAIGKTVLILWGKYKNMKGSVYKLNVDDYSIDVDLQDIDKIVRNLPYEQVCKYVT